MKKVELTVTIDDNVSFCISNYTDYIQSTSDTDINNAVIDILKKGVSVFEQDNILISKTDK